jgi:RNA polymerase subunit RPABC4/transcription elongation factor Spt4
LWRLNDVAAFCACCGAEITLKAEACPVCGTPQHGMSEPDLLLTLDVGTDPSQENVGSGRELRKPVSRKGQ